jgi:hypothetical protein
MPKPISLAQQIEEVEREIKLRESAVQGYGGTRGRRSSEAEFHLMRMKAVLNTLRWLQAHEATIRLSVAKSSRVHRVC